MMPIRVYKVKKTDFKDVLPVLGDIKGFREVSLKFATNGLISAFNFQEGEKIEEGDIIASLDQKDALLKLKYSQIELEKHEKLFEIGGIGKTKLDQVKLEYESAKSDFDKTNIYAISSGLLGSQEKQQGDYVTPNDKIGTFVDIGTVYAEFGIIENDVSKVALQQRTEVFVDAYSWNSYEGKVNILSPMIKGKSKTLTAKVELTNPKDELRPGMFARANIYTYEKQGVLIIPTSSLVKKENKYYVNVIQRLPIEEIEGEQIETGEVEIREIGIAYMTSDLVEIEKGIAEGDYVAIEVEEELKDKAKVEIMEFRETL